MTRRRDQPRPAASRPLGLRMRPDLVTQQRVVGQQRRWMIRDPLTLAHFQMADEEFALLKMLDGQASVDHLRAEFKRRFAPKRLSAARLLVWLGQLHRDGLLISEAPGEAQRLLERGRKQQQSDAASRVMNVLAIRFRGFDPDRLLDQMLRVLSPLFGPRWVVGGAVFALIALALVVIRLDKAHSRLPELHQMLGGANLLCLWLVLAGTKVVHELAHGLACKRYGGECHELGLMLLVFTPCLYCDVSDAWSIRSRWRRIAISAAGMYAELMLASMAAVLWLFSRPGLLNTICLDVMLVCGVSTFVVNGNPLLRYDGYFILSDLANSPNLWTRSRAVLRERLASWFIDDPQRGAEALDKDHRRWLALYAVFSICYRGFVVGAILLFLLTVLKPLGLQLIGQAVALFVVMGMILAPAVRMARAFSRPTAPAVRKRRTFGAAALAIMILLVVCLAPLPHRVAAPIMLEPHAAQRVYVSVPGAVSESAAVGERVRAGQVIAKLDNPELRQELAELSGEFAQYEARVSKLEAMRLLDPAANRRLPEAAKALVAARGRLLQRSEDLQRLELRAARDGIVLAPAAVPPPRSEQRELASWSGSPLDEANRGAALEAGTLVCLVGEADQFDAIAFVDAAAIRFIEPGQRVRVLLASHPGEALAGVVQTIAKADLLSVPPEMSRLLDIKPSSAKFAPIETRTTVYQVRLFLDAANIPLVDRMTGEARILVAPQSVGRRIARYLSRTFTFELDL